MSLAIHLPLLLILRSELVAKWSLLVSLKSKTTCIVLKGLHCAWMCSTPEANVNKWHNWFLLLEWWFANHLAHIVTYST